MNYNRLKNIFIILCLLSATMLSAQTEVIKLWQDVADMKNQPTKLYAYPTADSINTGVCIIICPGGSYSHLMGIKTEGFHAAQWLQSKGINAFVLRYRVGMYGYHHPAMIQDIQKAIAYVREHAQAYGIDADKIGVMGFSAGGHLVTMAGAFADKNYLLPLGVKTKVSVRPDFVVPVYPVVSMQDSLAHKRSRKNLLTIHYTPDLQYQFSMELQIKPSMPPTFLVTAKDDYKVKYQNSVALDKALTAQGVPHQFHLYEKGGHGYGMDERKAEICSLWREELLQWLKIIGVLAGKR